MVVVQSRQERAPAAVDLGLRLGHRVWLADSRDPPVVDPHIDAAAPDLGRPQHEGAHRGRAESGASSCNRAAVSHPNGGAELATGLARGGCADTRLTARSGPATGAARGATAPWRSQ